MRSAAVFTLKCAGVTCGWLSRVVLGQSGDKTLECQQPRQKTREPSAGKDPLPWSKLCHPTMTGREYGKSMARMPAGPDFFRAVTERRRLFGDFHVRVPAAADHSLGREAQDK